MSGLRLGTYQMNGNARRPPHLSRMNSSDRNDRPMHSSDRSERPVHSTDRSDRPVHLSDRSDRPVHLTDRSERPVQSSVRSDRPIQSTERSDRPIQSAGRSNRQVHSQHDDLIKYVYDSWSKIEMDSGSNSAVYYQEENIQHLKDFKPFDLEGYLNKRKPQNPSTAKHQHS